MMRIRKIPHPEHNYVQAIKKIREMIFNEFGVLPELLHSKQMADDIMHSQDRNEHERMVEGAAGIFGLTAEQLRVAVEVFKTKEEEVGVDRVDLDMNRDMDNED